jgi:hypothetical protein
MFYRPIRSAIANEVHAGVLTGMWHLITIHFSSAAIALLVLGAQQQGAAVAWLVAAQFSGCAAVYLAISLRLGGPWKLFQWMPFGVTAVLAALGAATAP